MVYYNPLGYACLEPKMLQKCMGQNIPDQYEIIDPFHVTTIEKELEKEFNVPTGLKKQPHLYSDDFFVPPLLADSIDQHFELMAGELVKKAQPGIDELIHNGEITTFAELTLNMDGTILMRENLEEEWVEYNPKQVDLFIPNGETLLENARPFWTRYQWNHKTLSFDIESVERPLEKGIIFDTETYVRGSNFAMPVLASAVHPTCVYIWIHPAILDDNAGYGYDPIDCTIDPHESPMPSLGDQGRFIVAHSSQYDQSRYAERYQFTNTPVNFWFDTQSAHTLCAGLASNQRWAGNLPDGAVKPKFMHYGSAKSLVKSYNFHVVPHLLKPKLSESIKEIRDAFVVAPSLGYLRERLKDLLSYALKDSVYTLQLFQVVYPKYRYYAPSNVVLAAHFLLAHSLIPIEKDWFEWIDKVEDEVEKLEERQEEIFVEMCDNVLNQWYEGFDIESDPWLSKMDWKIVGIKPTPMGISLNEERLLSDCETLQDFLDLGIHPIPRWYKSANGGKDLTAKKVDSHYLLKLSYKDPNGEYYPLEKTKELGWCYHIEGDYKRVPHKSGEEKNVGSLLTSNYISYFENGRLKAND